MCLVNNYVVFAGTYHRWLSVVSGWLKYVVVGK